MYVCMYASVVVQLMLSLLSFILLIVLEGF